MGRLRGKELREYEEQWAEWHAKYDRYATSDGKHFLNQVSDHGGGRVVCICGAEYYNAREPELLEALQHHLEDNEPPRVDVGALLDIRAQGG